MASTLAVRFQLPDRCGYEENGPALNDDQEALLVLLAGDCCEVGQDLIEEAIGMGERDVRLNDYRPLEEDASLGVPPSADGFAPVRSGRD